MGAVASMRTSSPRTISLVAWRRSASSRSIGFPPNTSSSRVVSRQVRVSGSTLRTKTLSKIYGNGCDCARRRRRSSDGLIGKVADFSRGQISARSPQATLSLSSMPVGQSSGSPVRIAVIGELLIAVNDMMAARSSSSATVVLPAPETPSIRPFRRPYCSLRQINASCPVANDATAPGR